MTGNRSSILGWRIPWTEEPGWLQSTGSQRVKYEGARRQLERSILEEVTNHWNLCKYKSTVLCPCLKPSEPLLPGLLGLLFMTCPGDLTWLTLLPLPGPGPAIRPHPHLPRCLLHLHTPFPWEALAVFSLTAVRRRAWRGQAEAE